MTAPQPAVENIINDLRLRSSEGPLSEFEAASYTQRAEKLKTSHPEVAFCALGIIACITDNEKDMRNYHERSLSLCSANQKGIYFFNYACSLAVMGFGQEAMKYFLKSVNEDPLEARHLNKAIRFAVSIEDSSMERLLGLWEKLDKKPHPIIGEIESLNITDFCMSASESSLEEIWNSKEETEAWEHLQ